MVQIVLHHLINSRSERCFWALEELGLPYSVEVYHREPNHRAPASLKGTGKAPMVELEGETLSESGYILSRLAEVAQQHASPEATGELKPSHSSAYYTHFAEGTLMLWMQASTLVSISSSPNAFGRAVGASEQEQEAVRKYAEWAQGNVLRPSTQSHLNQLEEFISKNEWFSGTSQPGIGDFMLIYPLVNVLGPAGSAPWQRASYDVGPGLKGWYERLAERPAYKRGVERRKREEEAAAGSR